MYYFLRAFILIARRHSSRDVTITIEESHRKC